MRNIIAAMSMLALVAGACSDDFGRTCELPPLIRDNCHSSSQETMLECVMNDNLSCESRICAVYQNSDPFCTLSCVTSSDCPEGASCVCFFFHDQEGSRYCVPDNLIPAEKKGHLCEDDASSIESDAGTPPTTTDATP